MNDFFWWFNAAKRLLNCCSAQMLTRTFSPQKLTFVDLRVRRGQIGQAEEKPFGRPAIFLPVCESVLHLPLKGILIIRFRILIRAQKDLFRQALQRTLSSHLGSGSFPPARAFHHAWPGSMGLGVVDARNIFAKGIFYNIKH